MKWAKEPIRASKTRAESTGTEQGQLSCVDISTVTKRMAWESLIQQEIHSIVTKALAVTKEMTAFIHTLTYHKDLIERL